MNIVGENIKQIREARNLTQAELAYKIGKNQRTISNWENGVRDPSSDNIRRIADALNIAPSEIIGHNSAPTDNTFDYAVDNNDMSPDIIRGDTLTVSKVSQIKDGDIVIAQSDSFAGHICRRLYDLGLQISLLAINPTIKPIVLDKANVNIKGRVTEIRRRL